MTRSLSKMLGPAVLLVLCAVTMSTAEQFVIIDSLCGKLEVQRAARQSWQPCIKKMKLKSNDMIHVRAGGFARLSWPDGTVSYVHQNTQMLITMVQHDDMENKLLNHATVFFGAVFFLVKKIAPRGVIDDSHLKVYTPTAVLAIRGTAFLASVDEKTGSTNVKVVNGTVQVRNILKTTAIFLGSPYQTTVALKTDPVPPTVVVQSDFDSLKKWVPVAVVTEAMNKQLAQVKKDSYAQSGTLTNRRAIIALSNNSYYQGAWPIGSAIAARVVEKLAKSDSSLNLMQKDSIVGDPIEAARTDTSRFAIIGIIERFDITQHAVISVRADEYREYSLANVRLKLRLVDALLGQLVAEETAVGEIKSTNPEKDSWEKISKLRFDLNDKIFSGTILGKAIEQAASQAAEKLSRYLE